MPHGPVGAVIEVVASVLPVLLVIWLLLVIRTAGEARRHRSRALRMALASELGIRPRDLVSMDTHALLRMRDQVTFDELTGVMRRLAGVAVVEREIHRARRQRSALSVCFVDVDGLKATNDKDGHAAGDQLLKNVARLLSERLRGQDLVFRYGGDEFVCVLPDCAAGDAERSLAGLRQQAADGGFPFSYGVAQLQPQDDIVTLLGRADGLLYDGRRARSVSGPQPQLVNLRPRSRKRVTATS